MITFLSYAIRHNKKLLMCIVTFDRRQTDTDTKTAAFSLFNMTNMDKFCGMFIQHITNYFTLWCKSTSSLIHVPT